MKEGWPDHGGSRPTQCGQNGYGIRPLIVVYDRGIIRLCFAYYRSQYIAGRVRSLIFETDL
jgi:hypothetical protein